MIATFTAKNKLSSKYLCDNLINKSKLVTELVWPLNVADSDIKYYKKEDKFNNIFKIKDPKQLLFPDQNQKLFLYLHY